LATSGAIFIVYFISYHFTLAINPNAQEMVKKIKQNINLLDNPVTTICGLICFFYSLVLIGLPLVYETFAEIDIYYSAGLGIIGLCLLIIPDDVKGALRKLINKKSE
jgi:hypothetical protein